MKQEQPLNMSQAEEINLSQIIKILWSARWYMAVMAILIMTLAYVFVAVKPIKPDIYQVTQYVEIASMQIQTNNQTEKPFLIERSRDIVKILPNISGVSAQFIVPKDTNKVVLIIASSVNRDQAIDQVKTAVTFLKERHLRMVSAIKGADVINPTAELGEAKVVFTPFKSQLKKYLLFSAIIGIIAGLAIFLLLQVIRSNKQNLSA